MCNALASYRPNQCFNCLYDYSEALTQPTNDTPTWVKVSLVALIILAMPPAILIDYCLSGAQWIYEKSVPFWRAIQAVEPEDILIGEFISPNEAVKKLNIPPYSLKENCSRLNPAFLRDAIDRALDCLPRDMQKSYTDLLKNDGMPHGDEPAGIDIFHWVAGCLTVHYLRTKPEGEWVLANYPYTGIFIIDSPNEVANYAARNASWRKNLDHLSTLSQELTQEERCSAFHRIMAPQTTISLSPRAKDFLKEMQKMASAIQQDPRYNLEIYKPMIQQLKKDLAEEQIDL
jgi:hypothetical protein